MSDINTPPPSPDDMTPAQANDRLQELSADKGWGKKLLAGDVETRREFSALMDLKHKGDRIDAAVAGKLEFQPLQVVEAGQLSDGNFAAGVQALKDVGIPDPVIHAFLSDEPVSPEDVQAIRELETRLKGDAEWTKKLLAGDVAARQVLLKISMGNVRIAKQTEKQMVSTMKEQKS